MDANLVQYFLTQGPFAVLFVWLFWSSRKESLERERKCEEREEQLRKVIDDQNDIMKGFSQKYDIVITKLDDIEERLPVNN